MMTSLLRAPTALDITIVVNIRRAECGTEFEWIQRLSAQYIYTHGRYNISGIYRLIFFIHVLSQTSTLTPFDSYLRVDAQPLEKGRPVELRFKLMPTSFRFLKGQVSETNNTCQVVHPSWLV